MKHTTQTVVSLVLIAVRITAQTYNSSTPSLDRQIPGAIDPNGQREWTRGYYGGYQQGLWIGIRDARPRIGPVGQFIVSNPGARITPYGQGFVVGYTEGYRKGYLFSR